MHTHDIYADGCADDWMKKSGTLHRERLKLTVKELCMSYCHEHLWIKLCTVSGDAHKVRADKAPESIYEI